MGGRGGGRGGGAGHSKHTPAVAVLLTCMACMQGLLTTASKVNGGYEYRFGVVVFLAEGLKLLIAAQLLRAARRRDPAGNPMTRDFKTMVMFPVPSVIYLVQNNIQFVFLTYVDPTSYQILGNLKIVTTGLFFFFFLKREMTRLKWIALLLLLVGATTSQLNTCGGKVLNAPAMGYAMGVASACLSAFAAVYTEYIMKRNNDCLHWQNAQLYFFGTVFNFLSLTAADLRQGFSDGFWLLDPFRGFSGVTWCVVANLALTGLVISWIMKYADSIVKVYATSLSMFLTMLVSVWLFEFQPNLQLVLGITTACSSLQLYYMRPSDMFGRDAADKH